jgi:hypothetical protein
MAPKRKSKKKAVESLIHDDFDDYRQWIRRADEDSQEIPLSRIREEWEELPEDHAAAFAHAVRDFHVAERAQDAADIKLREAVQKASRINETRRSERNLLGGQAELERIAVVEALRARQQATKALLLRLDALDIVLAARSPEGNQPTLLNYQQKLRRPVEDGDTQIGTWIELAEPFLIRVNWTPEHIDTFVIIAKGIEQDFSTDTWPPATAAGGTASPSKRKRQSENRESRSKVVRRPGDANASGCRSADAGAEESRPRSARAPATSQNSRQARPNHPPSKPRTMGSQHPTQRPDYCLHRFHYLQSA